MDGKGFRSSVAVGDIKSYFKEKLQQRMAELGISASELARQSGVSRSVLSGYLSNTLNMPTTLNLLRLSQALRVDPSFFLTLPADENGEQSITAIMDGGEAKVVNAELQALRHDLSSRPDRIVYYLPKTLPGPLKTDAVLRAEYGASFSSAIEEYRDFQRDMLGLHLFGNVLLDEAPLLDLVGRKGRYHHLSSTDANEQIHKIAAYARRSFPHLQFRVTNYIERRLNPCLVLGDDFIAIELFGRVRYIQKGMLVGNILALINDALMTAESLPSWLDHHWTPERPPHA